MVVDSFVFENIAAREVSTSSKDFPHLELETHTLISLSITPNAPSTVLLSSPRTFTLSLQRYVDSSLLET